MVATRRSELTARDEISSMASRRSPTMLTLPCLGSCHPRRDDSADIGGPAVCIRENGLSTEFLPSQKLFDPFR